MKVCVLQPVRRGATPFSASLQAHCVLRLHPGWAGCTTTQAMTRLPFQAAWLMAHELEHRGSSFASSEACYAGPQPTAGPCMPPCRHMDTSCQCRPRLPTWQGIALGARELLLCLVQRGRNDHLSPRLPRLCRGLHRALGALACPPALAATVRGCHVYTHENGACEMVSPADTLQQI